MLIGGNDKENVFKIQYSRGQNRPLVQNDPLDCIRNSSNRSLVFEKSISFTEKSI